MSYITSNNLSQLLTFIVFLFQSAALQLS